MASRFGEMDGRALIAVREKNKDRQLESIRYAGAGIASMGEMALKGATYKQKQEELAWDKDPNNPDFKLADARAKREVLQVTLLEKQLRDADQFSLEMDAVASAIKDPSLGPQASSLFKVRDGVQAMEDSPQKSDFLKEIDGKIAALAPGGDTASGLAALGTLANEYTKAVASGLHEEAVATKQQYDKVAIQMLPTLRELKHKVARLGEYASSKHVALLESIMPESLAPLAAMYKDPGNKLHYRGLGLSDPASENAAAFHNGTIDSGSIDFFQTQHIDAAMNSANPVPGAVAERQASQIRARAELVGQYFAPPNEQTEPGSPDSGKPVLPPAVRNRIAWEGAELSTSLGIQPTAIGKLVDAMAKRTAVGGKPVETDYQAASHTLTAIQDLVQKKPETAFAARFVLDRASTDATMLENITAPEQMAYAIESVSKEFNTAAGVVNGYSDLTKEQKDRALALGITRASGNVLPIADAARAEDNAWAGVANAETPLAAAAALSEEIRSSDPAVAKRARDNTRSFLLEQGVKVEDVDTIVDGIAGDGVRVSLPKAYSGLPGTGQPDGLKYLTALTTFEDFSSTDSMAIAGAYIQGAIADYNNELADPNTASADKEKIKVEIAKLQEASKQLETGVANIAATESQSSILDNPAPVFEALGITAGTPEAKAVMEDMTTAKDFNEKNSPRRNAATTLGDLLNDPKRTKELPTIENILPNIKLSELFVGAPEVTLRSAFGPEISKIVADASPETPTPWTREGSKRIYTQADAVIQALESKGLIQLTLRDNAKELKGPDRFTYTAVPQQASAAPRGTIAIGDKILNTPEQLVRYLAGDDSGPLPASPETPAIGALASLGVAPLAGSRPARPAAYDELKTNLANAARGQQEFNGAMTRNRPILLSDYNPLKGNTDAQLRSDIIRLTSSKEEISHQKYMLRQADAYNRMLRLQQHQEKMQDRRERASEARASYSSMMTTARKFVGLTEEQLAGMPLEVAETWRSMQPYLTQFLLEDFSLPKEE